MTTTAFGASAHISAADETTQALSLADDPCPFADSEYLRRVLIRICNTENGWNTDPEAEPLIVYAANRFAQLAVKHGLEPADAMAACFEAMRNPSVRYGIDPWGVIVTAVATTFRAWQFADEALTSIDTARRGGLSGCRAERFCERDLPIWEHNPAFAVQFPDECSGESESDAPASIPEQVHTLAALFTGCGWPHAATVVAIEVILRKLADAGSRPSAYEALRRERRWRAITGLPAASWTALLRLLLGTAGGDMTDTGKGVLLRLALGETVAHLCGDQTLIGAVAQTAPDVEEAA
ncbi:MAG: hypothetical protein FWF36_00280 [Propionibacteriaceae bacterium]|nr:hypothetical protein [Propionibacteriaceae bacterium]